MELRAFLERYDKSGTARFHMPGHKGILHPHDITEIGGADSLYFADGIIAQAERRISALYGTRSTVFSAGGSTLCIQAMLLHTLKRGDTLICGRNAHIALHNALALFGFMPHWIYPDCKDAAGVCGIVTPEQVEAAFTACPQAKAVYITSPDYMGMRSDIAGIAAVCKAHGVPLLVDNAHGAHLKFLNPDLHPITLGADLCCDSAHKTLPVLTGGAYLHAANADADSLKAAMALTGSTSPSYLILESLEDCADFLENKADAAFATLKKTHAHLWQTAKKAGFDPIPDTDCTKLALNTYAAGISAGAFADRMRQCGIECEYAGGSHIVFLMTPFNTEAEFDRLETALSRFQKRSPLPFKPFCYPQAEAACTPAEAFCGASEIISVEQATGRISAQAASICPPGVPIVTYGERISPETASLLKNSGFCRINVLK